MKTKVKSVAEVNSGLTYRSRVGNNPEGEIALFQMRDLDWSDMSLKDSAHRVLKQEIPGSQELKSGDIGVVAKGLKNGAFVFRKSYRAAATSSFLILRPDPEKIVPEYLAWYLNQESTQRVMHSSKVGSTIPNITKSVLEELTIKLPSLNVQRKLVNLYSLWQEEKRQCLNLITMKDKYYNNLALAEIESGHYVEPYTDDTRLWVGYELSGNYHMAQLKFKESIFIKKFDKPLKEMVAIILDMERYKRSVETAPGSFLEYMAVKEWRVILPRDLRTYNEGQIPKEKKEDEIVNVIPHSLIESITMVDRYGNYVEPINPWK